MDFVHKNFSYMTMSLAELAGRCATPQAYTPLSAPGERYGATTSTRTNKYLGSPCHVQLALSQASCPVFELQS